MFPSIVSATANDNYYIAGSITSLLLSGSCKEDVFYDIPTHVRSRLTNASSSTSSDYCYAIFGHDLMCSIDANHCDIRQHRKWMTSSNTAAGGLDLCCKDDSIFLHSIPKFICNMRKHSGTKPICEWLDDNERTTNFPNWDTYSFFQQQEIKRALHQSDLGLFLRVWEEVSTIFIDYLSNSPSKMFLKMLAVFFHK